MCRPGSHAGQQVTAYVRRAEQMDKLAAIGVKPITDISDLFDCDMVISMLPHDTPSARWCSAERTSAFLGCLRA
jgi:3-hydroxyisobutyrate dehydrogenase-like beta-hydroxyacid dehydrogenase